MIFLAVDSRPLFLCVFSPQPQAGTAGFVGAELITCCPGISGPCYLCLATGTMDHELSVCVFCVFGLNTFVCSGLFHWDVTLSGCPCCCC